VAFVYSGGQPHLVRDGRDFSLGSVFGNGDALEAVEGSPEAVAAMRTFLERRRWGTALLFLGSAIATTGTVILLASSDPSKPLVYGLLGGGTAVSGVGLSISTSGVARLFDAINLYNDPPLR
jgi:hypothetical protein